MCPCILKQKNRYLLLTAVCFASIELNSKKFIFANAGLIEPLLKTDESITYVKAIGSTLPLGSVHTNVYQEKIVQLKSGDLIITLIVLKIS
ncbi:MAG: hypothetical protein DWQ10_13645 [Calditrichaeota bacterium]|nr:MAG: hypothetical protein DWQ10_13645 [Calditrichota bacterium]